MNEHNIMVESGTSKRFLTAGKYCDRDIIVTALGGSEDLGDVLNEQESKLNRLITTLEGKAAGGGANKYAKFTATPTSALSFNIENPLGGVAKSVSIKAISPTTASTRKIHFCCLDGNSKLGAIRTVSSSDSATYVMSGTDSTPNNGQFRIIDGLITVYRFNSANTWDTGCEYEIEIYQ